MRKLFYLITLLPFLLFYGCNKKSASEREGRRVMDDIAKVEKADAQSEGTWLPDTVYFGVFKYCYGTVWTGDRLLVSNYGGTVFDPLGITNDGYISQIKDGVVSSYLQPGCGLMSPKGMAVYKDHLFVADINSIFVFDMNNLKKKARKIILPQGSAFVSDLSFQSDYLFASVKDASLVYMMQITDPDNLSDVIPDVVLGVVPGANGIVAYKDTMYVCSYPANDSITPQNCIYMVLNLQAPNTSVYTLEKWPGFYCGIDYDPVRRYVYYTDEREGQLRRINMNDATAENNKLLFPKNILISPQMLTLADGRLFVPDVATGSVYVFKVKP